MAFALAVTHLIDMLRQPGCPACAAQRYAARKAVDNFLWENLMDREVRQQTVLAGGFCPPHTRLLAAAELASSGRPLGVNLLYETLARKTATELRRRPDSGPAGWLASLFKPASSRPSVCQICAAGDAGALDALTTLFEELEHESSEMTAAYLASDGLCRAHLEQGLTALGGAHPRASRWLADQAADLLETQAGHMLEMIRKQNWEYREELLTPAEADAWRKVLTFYTGYPGETFTFKRDDEPDA